MKILFFLLLCCLVCFGQWEIPIEASCHKYFPASMLDSVFTTNLLFGTHPFATEGFDTAYYDSTSDTILLDRARTPCPILLPCLYLEIDDPSFPFCNRLDRDIRSSFLDTIFWKIRVHFMVSWIPDSVVLTWDSSAVTDSCDLRIAVLYGKTDNWDTAPLMNEIGRFTTTMPALGIAIRYINPMGTSENRAPVFSICPEDTYTICDSTLTVSLLAGDLDHDSIIYSLNDPPIGASISGNTVNYTPPDTGLFQIVVLASDLLLSDTCDFWVRVDSITYNISEGNLKPESACYFISPNPFNSSVLISISGVETRHASSLQIEIFDTNGRMVATPSPSVPLPKGEGKKEVNPKEEGGQVLLPPGERFRIRGEFVWSPEKSLPSGVYLIRANTSDGKIAEKRIIHLK